MIHRDPVVCRDLTSEDGGSILHGNVNFGSDIWYSDFELRCDGRTEVRIGVEVFPTARTFPTDYQDLVAEVQEQLLGLALEYLRPTHQEGASTVEAKTISNGCCSCETGSKIWNGRSDM